MDVAETSPGTMCSFWDFFGGSLLCYYLSKCVHESCKRKKADLRERVK